MKTILLSITMLFYSVLGFTQITINEVDVNTPGTDMMEFIELYSETSVSLDGHVLVFFNGNGDESYSVIDLTGNMITDGFFVIGNAATPNVDVVFDNNSLQNGADAVALYTGTVDDFPAETPVTTTNLVDAVVYGTNDDNDLGLFALLDGGCQIQVDEDANGDDDNQSSARIPDGGTALCPDDFAQQAPSPGETNVPSCFGGVMAFSSDTTEETLCIDDDIIEVLSYTASNVTGDNSIFVITDEDNVIIATTTSLEFNSTDVPEGVCRIHHIAFNGTLDAETTAAGEDASAISTDGDCLSFASNFLTIYREVCFPDCDGGMVSSDAGSEVVVCLDDEADILTYSNTSIATEATYSYVITDENNMLITILTGDANDFNGAEAGVCRVWGMSYQGDLTAETITDGSPLFGIQSSMCVDISENFINVTRQECAEVEGCGSIFFSEYQEGSASNKVLEIYNPTQLPFSLSDYQLVNCGNGCDIEGTWDFQNDIFEDAVIQPGDVFTIVHPSADAALLAEADIEFQFLSNGDDVFALQQISTEEIIDIIGENGPDPGTGWTVNGVENGTQNHTLVRMPQFNEGNPDWSTANLEWEVLDQDVWENTGSHTIIPCTTNSETSLSFASGAMTVNEEDGMATVSVNVLNPLDEEMTVEVMLTGGTAASPDDFDGTVFPLTLTFPAGMEMAQTFDITLVDDAMEEGEETVMLSLMNPSEGVELGTDMFTLTINPSDVVIPVMTIADASANDADGVAINDGMEVELRGVVYGVNMRPAGLQFTLIDPTDGIGLFNFEGDLGYTVTEGDSVHVVGSIGQFNGLTQIAPESVELISAGNALVDPLVVSTLDEISESYLVRIECVELVDPSQWINDGSGFNVDLTDGTNTYLMRVDADTDVFGTAAPEGVFTLTGIGGQFDGDTPYDEGYQILPRYIEDVPAGLVVDFMFDEASSTGVFFLSDNQYSAGPGTIAVFEGDNSELDYLWEINGTEFSGNTFELTVDESWNFVPQDLIITATDGTCSVSMTVSIEFIWPGVEEIESLSLSIFPNPASSELTIDSPVNGILTVYNQMGQAVRNVDLVNPGQQTISVLDLSTGVYYLELTSENTVYRAQFIKN